MGGTGSCHSCQPEPGSRPQRSEKAGAEECLISEGHFLQTEESGSCTPEDSFRFLHFGQRMYQNRCTKEIDKRPKPGEKRRRGRRNPVLRDTGFLDRYSYYPKTTILKSARIQTVPQKRKARNLCLTFADDWADGWLFLYLVSQCTIESQN